MSKELQAFRDILGILSAVSGCEVDMNSERIITVQQALKRLESIDNSTPSEALESLEYIENKLKDLEYIAKKNDNEYLLSKYIPSEKFDIIRQALLKAQEPKHYLKWEDLEFSKEVKEMKVKLGDNTYEIEYYICNALGLRQPVVILKTSDFIAITIEQFFNDLHLERVEE